MNGAGSVNLEKAAFMAIAKRQRKPCIIPLFVRVPAPSFSPVELYRSLIEESGRREGGGRSRGFLLESMDGDRNTATYSFFGLDPVLNVTCYRDNTEVTGDAGILGNIEFPNGRDAIETIKFLIGSYSVVPSPVPRFPGGLVGYFSYDLIYSLLPGSAKVRNKSGVSGPLAEFMFCPDNIVLDHYRSELWIVRNVISHEGRVAGDLYEENLCVLLKRKECVEKFLNGVPSGAGSISGQGSRDAARPGPASAGPAENNEARREAFTNNALIPPSIESEIEKERFMRSVSEVKELVHGGEIVQAVISRKEAYPFTEDPLSLYQALRSVNPSPYMYYIDFSDYSVVGASPEMLVRVEGRDVTTVPIAGTRKRGVDSEEDRLLEEELLNDQKERAEHVMLVDLARNDVGSVCAFGSVEVPQFMQIGKYSHVQHIISTVTGKISDNYDSFDVFRACFPAGTVSGAPKVRAMEIIAEQEPLPRGLYAGAVGHIGFDGGLEFAIAIRTAIVKAGKVSLQAGAGIVADSDPEREWIETNQKLAAMKMAVNQAGRIT